MTFWKTKEFKALQDAWYRRLESLGFQDAERSIGHEMRLKKLASHSAYRDADELTIESKTQYFNILSEKINEAEFLSEVDRLVMTWYCDGMNIKHICIELDKLGMKRGRDTIRWTIRKYEMRWGMKQYTPRQLHIREK